MAINSAGRLKLLRPLAYLLTVGAVLIVATAKAEIAAGETQGYVILRPAARASLISRAARSARIIAWATARSEGSDSASFNTLRSNHIRAG
jgi:hypothetical protein